MNDDLEQFEAELRRRRPQALSPVLVDRIRRELVPLPRRRSVLREWWWAFALPTAAAAGLVVTLAWRSPARRHPVPAPLAQSSAPTVAPAAPVQTAAEPLAPVKIENVLFSARDEGLVRLADGSPARKQRLQFVDTITWKNPGSNASIVWTLPREEIRVVRVIYY
jgi:hypothetical protein